MRLPYEAIQRRVRKEGLRTGGKIRKEGEMKGRKIGIMAEARHIFQKVRTVGVRMGSKVACSWYESIMDFTNYVTNYLSSMWHEGRLLVKVYICRRVASRGGYCMQDMIYTVGL